MVGQNFGPAGLAWAPSDGVTVNGAQCSGVTRVNHTHLRCTTPPNVGLGLIVAVVISNQLQTGAFATLTQAGTPDEPRLTTVVVKDGTVPGATPTNVEIGMSLADVGGVGVRDFHLRYVLSAARTMSLSLRPSLISCRLGAEWTWYRAQRTLRCQLGLGRSH